MARISVLGGTGYGGEAVVREAARRGHAVTSYSRRLPEQPVDGVTYVHGSLLDADLLARSVRDADVVFEALSPRGDMQGKGYKATVNDTDMRVRMHAVRALSFYQPTPDAKKALEIALEVLKQPTDYYI